MTSFDNAERSTAIVSPAVATGWYTSASRCYGKGFCIAIVTSNLCTAKKRRENTEKMSFVDLIYAFLTVLDIVTLPFYVLVLLWWEFVTFRTREMLFVQHLQILHAPQVDILRSDRKPRRRGHFVNCIQIVFRLQLSQAVTFIIQNTIRKRGTFSLLPKAQSNFSAGLLSWLRAEAQVHLRHIERNVHLDSVFLHAVWTVGDNSESFHGACMANAL